MSSGKVIELDHTFEIYIPTQCICGEDLDKKLRDEVVLFAKNKFYDWFGGATVSPANGIWRLPDGTIADENVDILTSLADDDSFDDYQDDAKKLAVTIADRLSQDRVLLKIDGKGFLFARTDENARCGHNGKIASADPKKVIDATLDPVSVYYSLSRFASLRDARHLFCNVLNYKMVSTDLPWGSWKDSVRQLLTEIPEVIADTNGFRIVHLHLASETLKRGAERQIIQRIYQDDPSFRGLFVVSNRNLDNWELINAKSPSDSSRSLTLRRMRVGIPAVRTATERIIKLHISESEEKSITPSEIQARFDEAFDVTALTRQFFREISDWYFWAKGEVNFPPGQERTEHEVVQATCVIRLLTRLMFVWFLKQKRVDGEPLIPHSLFDKKALAEILKGFDPEGLGTKQPSHYYKAILQNLFFATLNQPVDKRRWRKEGKEEDKNVYRYQALFRNPDEALALFKDIPFLNGGLFECLEQDQFSDLPDVVLKVPDYLFFSPPRCIDLNRVYGTNNKKYSVSGIIDILERYNFTVEENTPLEEEIALDPELLGKVFENLLASFNPETGETARKQTGSFYTPREIVDYMVDESLKACLLQKLASDEGEADQYREKLERLLSYDNHDENPFGEEETRLLIDALHSLKILDPACGSGAFPMGILHKMTHLLKKLDPGNRLWKERQLRAVEDPAMREHIERTFDANDMDYGRKLYLIQRCIYGVDIQPIAVQISKLRFFISLIVDQQIHKSQPNWGILPLPNMETRFVAANTLLGLEKPQQLMLRDPAIKHKEDELVRVRKEYFNASSQKAKQKCMLEDERLRKEIGELLKKDHWPATTASKIAAWNPYDLTASSEFFDPEWMFGIGEGFDIVIGNPPYIQIQNFSGQQIQKEWENQNYESFAKTGDVYCLFYEKGYQLLRKGGVLAYITSNKWMRAAYGDKLRRFFLDKVAIHQLIDFGDSPIFSEATTYTNILLFEKGRQRNAPRAWDLSSAYRKATSLARMLEENQAGAALFNEESFVIASAELAAIKNRIEQVATPLKEWDIAINYGIKTSFNEAFIIDGKKKNELIAADPKSAEIIKPILRGRDIKRYRVDFADLWLIATFPALNLNIDAYPAVREYLKSFGRKLHQTGEVIGKDENGNVIKSRKKTGNKWFETQDQIAYYAEFAREKIVYAEIVFDSAFYHDNSGSYPEATAFVLTGESTKYLTALLNSQLLTFAFRAFYAGGDLRGDTFRYKKVFLQNLPVIKPKAPASILLEDLVDYVQMAKSKDQNLQSAYFEQLIDTLVYELYFPDEMKAAGKEILPHLGKLTPITDQMSNGEKLAIIQREFDHLYDPRHPVRTIIETLESVEVVRTIREALKR